MNEISILLKLISFGCGVSFKMTYGFMAGRKL